MLGQFQSQQFSDLMKVFGLPGAVFLTFLYLLAKGIGFVMRREYDAAIQRAEAAEKDRDVRVRAVEKDRDERLTELKEETDKRLESLRAERNYWREAAMQNLQVAERATQATEAAVKKVVETATPKPPDGE